MGAARQRRVRGRGARLTEVRRAFGSWSWPDDRLAAIDAVARRAGAVDPTGRRLDNEVARILGVLALTRNEDTERRAFRAARINIEMSLAAMGPRLSKLWAYGRQNGHAGVDVDDDGVPCPRGGCGPTTLRLGSWIRERLDPIKGKYRDEEGVVQDLQLCHDLLMVGLQDPQLPAVLDAYRKIMAPIKSDMARFERAIEQSLEAMRSRWTKTVARATA